MAIVLIVALFAISIIYSFYGWTGVIISAAVSVGVFIWIIKSAAKQAEAQAEEKIKAEKEKLFQMQLRDTQRIFSDCYTSHWATEPKSFIFKAFVNCLQTLRRKADRISAL